ncbi:MAG: DUF2007 domain-containing protein [Opitutus sp.]
MITVAHCNTIDEALLLRSVLEGSGVPAFVPDEAIAQTAPTYMFGSPSGVRLQVEDDNVARAREVLEQNGQRPLA